MTRPGHNGVLTGTSEALCCLTELAGYAAASSYMAGFQVSAPDARFVTTGFRTHHDRCIVQ